MKLSLLVVCSLIAASFAGPAADREEKIETVLNDIESVLQGLREDKPVPKVEIEGDLADMMKKSQRTFNEEMEEVLLHADDIAKAEEEVKALGGRVKIQLGHDLLVAKVPSHVAANHAFTQSSTHISSSASPTTLSNVRAYHMSREDKLKPQPPVMSWTAKTPPKSFPRKDSDALIQGESPYMLTLTGKIVAVILIASGPGSLAISNSEKANILSEVQTGLDFWAKEAAAAGQRLSFVVYSGTAYITASNPSSCPNDASCHDVFADPTLQAFGYATGQAGRDKLAQDVKGWAKANGTFLAFFCKYRQIHFAYSYFGGGPIYMQYSNGGWGPKQIDRVFAHEMGHVFNAPDEYAHCECGELYGQGSCKIRNTNCVDFRTGFGCTAHQQGCIMDSNDLKHICASSKKHVGWC